MQDTSLLNNTIDDISICKQKRKKLVLSYAKSFIKQKKQYGFNSLEVLSATEKYVEFAESQNGLQHTHKARHSAESAYTYIGYKLSILARHSEHSIDVNAQSPAYKQQLANIECVKDEICYFIKYLHEQSKCKLTYCVQFVEEQIIVQLDNGQSITMWLQYSDTSEKIIITHDVDLSKIMTIDQYTLLTFITSLTKLVIDKSCKMSLEMLSFCHTLIVGSRQLQKLQSLSDDEQIDMTMKADIVQHIERSKVGDTYSYIIGQHEYDDVEYIRFFKIRKITRVRTVVEVLAVSNTDTIIEYRSVISKISHNITDNSNLILSMFNALK